MILVPRRYLRFGEQGAERDTVAVKAVALLGEMEQMGFARPADADLFLDAMLCLGRYVYDRVGEGDDAQQLFDTIERQSIAKDGRLIWGYDDDNDPSAKQLAVPMGRPHALLMAVVYYAIGSAGGDNARALDHMETWAVRNLHGSYASFDCFVQALKDETATAATYASSDIADVQRQACLAQFVKELTYFEGRPLPEREKGYGMLCQCYDVRKLPDEYYMRLQQLPQDESKTPRTVINQFNNGCGTVVGLNAASFPHDYNSTISK